MLQGGAGVRGQRQGAGRNPSEDGVGGGEGKENELPEGGGGGGGNEAGHIYFLSLTNRQGAHHSVFKFENRVMLHISNKNFSLEMLSFNLEANLFILPRSSDSVTVSLFTVQEL